MVASTVIRAPIVASGWAIGEGAVTGVARFIATAGDLGALKPGEILMAEATGPEWESAMVRAAAIVTNSGGASSHAARAARAAGQRAVVGTVDGASGRWTGALVTVRCIGQEGLVFEGLPASETDRPGAGPRPIAW